MFSLILFYHLRTDFPSGLLICDFEPKFCMYDWLPTCILPSHALHSPYFSHVTILDVDQWLWSSFLHNLSIYSLISLFRKIKWGLWVYFALCVRAPLYPTKFLKPEKWSQKRRPLQYHINDPIKEYHVSNNSIPIKTVNNLKRLIEKFLTWKE